MFYDLLKKCVSIFFNMLNKLMGGKLPPFGSACAIVEENDRYLVVELPDKRIVFPGGFMNWSEHPRQAAEREGYEETGLILRASDMVGYYPSVSDSWTNMSNIGFAFRAEVVGGTMHKTVEGRPYWLHESELRLRLSKHSQQILDDYLHLRERKRTTKNSRTLAPVAS